MILAICSKNNEADVMEVLAQHPDMQLREQHFAAFQVNWDDKATNLRRIAKQLNIGLDALVFADDSQFECGFVRENLPEVAVLHLGGEPSSFVSRLGRAGYFDSLTFSAEDRERTRMYRDEAQRQQLMESAGSLEGYLGKLGIVATIGRADQLTIPRISQLTQKTNQFNLTTCRYSEGEILALSVDSSADVFYMKLRDRISEMGLIGIAILRYQGREAELDSFLLSCRALGRGAEDCLLAHCVKAAAARGCTRVRGRYIPTKKNGQVAEFYPSHGFQPCTGDPGQWELQLGERVVPIPHWITVELL